MRRLVVALLLVLFAFQASRAVFTKSATWDETHYFGLGTYLLENQRWDVPSSILHPPLAFYLDALPLFAAGLDKNVWNYPASQTRDLAFLGAMDINRGQTLLASPANKDDTLLIRSRLMVVAQALLLGFFVYRLGLELYGVAGGLIALALFAFCPNMLAHAGLITPDMTVTTCSFMAIFYFRRLVLDGKWTSATLAGVSLGLALLSKFTAALLLPIEAVLLVFLLARRQRVSVGRVAAAWSMALFVLALGYGFHLTPYLQGIEVQQSHAALGHDAFLMGTLGTGWWYYLPIAFVLKTPIPLIVAFVVAAVLAIRKLARRTISFDDVCLWLPVIAVTTFFCIGRQSIGLRYILPIYPFVFVLAAGVLSAVRRYQYAALVPLAWYAFGTWQVGPDYLAYFNEIAGGPSQGYRYLVDSNLDWGQDLKGLKRFMDEKHIDRIYLSYFGSDSPSRYGIEYDWLPSYELANPDPESTVGIARHHFLAISATNLQGVYMTPPTTFRFLDQYTPVAQVGHSIFVYWIP